MAGVADIVDVEMRSLLAGAEAALDNGDYVGSVHACVDAYRRLIDVRPDMIIAPRFAHRFAAPQLGSVPSGIGGQSMAAPRPWPSDHGVRFSMEGDVPELTFTKERFTLSEAATYFEYTLDIALRAQRLPPQP